MLDPALITMKVVSSLVAASTDWVLSFSLRQGDIFAFMSPPSKEQMRYTENRFKVLEARRPKQGTHTERVIAVDIAGNPLKDTQAFDTSNNWVKLI